MAKVYVARHDVPHASHLMTEWKDAVVTHAIAYDGRTCRCLRCGAVATWQVGSKMMDKRLLSTCSAMGDTVEVRRVQAWMDGQPAQIDSHGRRLAYSDLQATVIDAIDGRDLAKALVALCARREATGTLEWWDDWERIQARARSLVEQGTHPADAADEGRVS
jgi:hypothetical protein